MSVPERRPRLRKATHIHGSTTSLTGEYGSAGLPATPLSFIHSTYTGADAVAHQTTHTYPTHLVAPVVPSLNPSPFPSLMTTSSQVMARPLRKK